MSDQVMVDKGLRIENESLLQQLQLVNQEHDEYRNHQRDEGRVERDTQILGDTCDIALDSPMRLTKRSADTAHGTNEAD